MVFLLYVQETLNICVERSFVFVLPVEQMSTLAIQSILEELRCMDGELFKTEVAQKLFLLLKTQATESLAPLYGEKSLAEYSRAIDKFKSWPVEISQEELFALETRAGGKEELRQLWTSVSAQWVRLTKKSEGAKASVKIRTPDASDVLKSFFLHLISKTWCFRGELWTMDPLKQDFVFREVFRQAVGDSVFVLDDVKHDEEELKEQKTEKRSKPKFHEEVEKHREEEPRQKEVKEETRQEEEKVEVSAPKEPVKEEVKESPAKEVFKSEETVEHDENLGAEKLIREDEEDEIGPDDSVSHFFDNSSVVRKPEIVALAPTRRYADAGTVAYAPMARRAVQPLKIQLQSPLQNIPE